MKAYTISSLLILIYMLDAVSSEKKLLLVQTIFRHGDRAPVTKLTSEESRTHFYRGIGHLTNTGIRQAQLLGQALRKEYVDTGFISSKMVPDELHFQSSGSDRCIQTAATAGAAMFDETEDNLPVSVPVRTALIKADDPTCYGDFNSRCVVEAMQRGLKIAVDGKNANKVRDHHLRECGMNTTTFNREDRWNLIEALPLEKRAGLAVPIWFNDEAERDANNCKYRHLALISSVDMYYDVDGIRAMVGYTLHTLFRNMDAAITCDKESATAKNCGIKFRAYSTHDIMLLSLAEALSVRSAAFNDTAPHYTAAFAFELWKTGTHYSVKISVRRSETETFESIGAENPFCEKKEFCPYPALRSGVEPYIVHEVKDICPEPRSFFSDVTLLSFILFGTTLLFMLAFFVTLFALCRKRTQEKSRRF